MEDYPCGWKTFNEFFARHIDLEKRPVASPGDDTVIVCPADCIFGGVWPVNDPTADVTTFDVKGVPWEISQLLADDSSGTDYGKLFAGGTFAHSLLAPNDYHRQHAPVAGTVEAKVIPGVCYLGVALDTKNTTEGGWPTLAMHRYMRRRQPEERPINDIDAPDSPGYQFLQARGSSSSTAPSRGLSRCYRSARHRCPPLCWACSRATRSRRVRRSRTSSSAAPTL